MTLPKLRKLQAGNEKGKGQCVFEYIPFSLTKFYAGKSPSNRNSGITSSIILNPTILNPTGEASDSSKLSLVSGKKRKNNAPPSNSKGSKVQKSDNNSAKVDARMDSSGEEEIDDFSFQGAIPDGLIPRNGHSRCRQKSALAWKEAMPSFTYPLMAALHKIKQDKSSRRTEMEGSTCQSGCKTKGASIVNIISFEGVCCLKVYILSYH